MVCIYCGSKTRVTNSRSSNKNSATWRRRECKNCQSIFTTREGVDYAEAFRVKGESGPLQPFWRDKLLISIHTSLSHRKTALADAESLMTTVLNSLQHEQQKGLLTTAHITKTTGRVLERFDTAAAVHYKAHHAIS